MIQPVILAGGSGTRLWPLSRELYPKQMLCLTGEQTMLQNTLLRLKDLNSIQDPIIVCNQEHRFMAAEQLRQIEVKPFSILLEPLGRNTAPAICAAALMAVSQQHDPVLLVLPADHVIENLADFHKAIEVGKTHARKGELVTFGIVPDSPETGYGYIKKGDPVGDGGQAFVLDSFFEKPDSETAVKYLKSGDFFWNSGMFMFKVSAILGELERFVPEIVASCRLAMEKGVQDLDFFRLDQDGFAASPSNSIDYAVMEHTQRGVMIPLEAGWNDLGSWNSLWKTGKKDENANVIKGDVMLSDVKNSYLFSESRLVAAVGIEDLVVVETKDAVLVATREKVKEIKTLVKELREKGRIEAFGHRKIYRPWGSYESVDDSQRFQVKRITVKPGAKLSLQKHYHRAEHWTVVSGTAIITKGDEELLLKEDESVYIPLGVMHRMENPGRIPLELIEVQSGTYLGEDDIVRFEDVYGRLKL
ncbi:MAG: mannose-1-phosphate guanylyltransferase/mannose-6-phosphate isomerase [Desulfobacterium sp.]|nr:mannose-1-phosphate guanylyltransferase/mannose-6-phosphate isomerase [Desulfobacterium sp.]